jgi:hypothetical protein
LLRILQEGIKPFAEGPGFVPVARCCGETHVGDQQLTNIASKSRIVVQVCAVPYLKCTAVDNLAASVIKRSHLMKYLYALTVVSRQDASDVEREPK